MIYVASPYSHPLAAIRQERFEDVRDMMAHWLRRGRPVVSPILMFHPVAIAYPNIDIDYKAWLNVNDALLRHASQLWVVRLDGWDESKGVAHEIDLAKRLHITTRYFDEAGQEVL